MDGGTLEKVYLKPGMDCQVLATWECVLDDSAFAGGVDGVKVVGF